ncbi:hypothetical protein PV963_39675 [Streptomyces coeruleorubidus]|uniref:hypothetical protein n=1 Tax=Streptomyces coeruleorubidus TaxID=116188 RepID=UPI00237FA30B|nr:hypothetical protein [Streptomyces coeruleorubidus]WDV56026.1 hypothetical protein PV963_39675 [Streptomyces coeruleorubidus]
MRKGTVEYEQALGAMVEILRARARQGAEFLQYGQLSAELSRRAPYQRPSDDTELWINELKDLAKHYAHR